ncbi:MAG: Holliday junction resolvase RuvX [Deltaproteobacteria bacterium]|nr:Holliday junction resolvase RuvX [Deltaproteobacteria bacterium]NIS77516.1 Holliday junction resolvase RuvX [Deltaproteobacteria bacterium]
MGKKTAGRRLCLDYGKKKIGIAISDPTATIAQPHSVMERETEELDIEKIHDLVATYGIKKVIMGLPLELSGEAGQSAMDVFQFIEKLKVALEGVEIETWDERLSTVFAEKEMIRDNVRRKKRKKVIDQLAATIILQSFLDAESRDG